MSKVIVEKFDVKSSLVRSIYYNHESNSMEVLYKNGKKGTYSDFSENELHGILESPSIGKALLKKVKSRRPKARKKFLGLF